jgi:hypothetical protein
MPTLLPEEASSHGFILCCTTPSVIGVRLPPIHRSATICRVTERMRLLYPGDRLVIEMGSDPVDDHDGDADIDE